MNIMSEPAIVFVVEMLVSLVEERYVKILAFVIKRSIFLKVRAIFVVEYQIKHFTKLIFCMIFEPDGEKMLDIQVRLCA